MRILDRNGEVVLTWAHEDTDAAAEAEELLRAER
jgi:hypothetical protein